jgi:hypothetical protein
MGGFMLFEGDVAKGVLSHEKFSELLTAGKIEFPTVSVAEIEDRSKGDGFSKTIAVGQTLWFIVQCLARRAQHLDVTLIELLTLSLAVLNGVMYFLWWHKPLDVRCPVRVHLLDKPDEPKECSELKESDEPAECNEPNKSDEPAECNEPNKSNEPNEPNKANESNKSNEPNESDGDSILEIKDCFGCEFSSSLKEQRIHPNKRAVYPILKSLFSESEASPKISEPEPLSETPEQTTDSSILANVIVGVPIFIAIGIPVLIIFLVLALMMLLLVVGAFSILFPLWLLYHLTTRWIDIMMEGGDLKPGDMKVPTFYSYKPEDGEGRASLLLVSAAGVVFGGIHCAGWFFTFPSSNEAILWRVCSVVLTGVAILLPPLCYYFASTISGSAELAGSVESAVIATIVLTITVYVLSRLLLLVEAFISLRHLTPGMLAVVRWTYFLPHI